MPGKEVAIVNQRFAAKYFQDQDPLAKRVLLELPDRPGSPRRAWLPIVGLCANIVQNDPTKPEPDALVYIPAQLHPLNNVGVIARIHNNPKALITAFRKEVQNLDQDLPVFSASTLAELFTQKRWAFRVFGTLFSLFAAFALILASVGLYAVMAYGVVQRTPEIGVRIALGASRANILSLVVRTGLYQFAIGLVQA